MSNVQVAEPAPKTQSLVLRNAIILVGAQVLGTPLSIFMNAVLGRYLGAADFGRIYLMTTFCQLGFLFVDWGQNDLLPGEIAQNRSRAGELLGTALAWRVSAAIVMYGVLSALCLVLGYEDEIQFVLALIALQTLFGSMISACQSSVRGLERTDVGAIGQIAQQVLLLVLVFPALALGFRLRGALVAQATAMAIVFAVTFGVLRSVGIGRLSFKRETIRTLLVKGTPFLGFGISLHLQSNLDAVFLSKFSSEEVVGWHAVAKRLVGALIIPAAAIIGALYPTLSRLHVEDPQGFVQTTRSSLRGTAVLAVPLALCCALYRDLGVQIFSKAAFGPAQGNLLVLSAFVFLLYFSMPIGSALLAAGKQRVWAVTQFLCVVVSVALNPFLIPWFQKNYANGGLGLCVATVVSEVGMVAIGIALSPSGVFDRGLVSTLFRTFLAGAAMGVTGWFLRWLTPFVAAPIALAVYAGALWAVGGVDKHQLTVVKQAIARKAARKAAG